jgi:methylmalonyl-CoA/ethylmalonyl-CoA epimerase
MQFSHIGIAVESIEKYFLSVLQPVFKCKMTGEIVTDELQSSKIAFAETVDGTCIELVVPLNEDSPVAAILRNRRGGLYHLCFVADNFEADMEKCKANKFVMVSSPKPAIAFNNKRVVFFISPSNELIELLEP